MEMNKLINLLTEAGIPFNVRPHWGGSMQVCYPVGPAGNPDCICDVVSFFGSYGGDAGLLEIMGLVDTEDVGDDVEGWLTAADVFARIKKHYEETH